MTIQPKPAPAIIVIFGITGDLAQRKLLPALYHLLKDNLLDERTVILGITRRSVTADELLSQVELCVNEIDQVCEPVALKKVHSALRMHQMSLVDGDEYNELLKLLNDIETERGVCMSRLYYLSIPPQMFEPIVKNLGTHGLNQSCQHGNAATRLLVEKPFGYDLASAQDLIQETATYFNETQLFRIDHYLAKQTVQNILTFRLSSPDFTELWNNRHISSIEITAYEKIDIEGRATFYDQIGALRDFIQSHLIQLLAIVTMRLPDSLDSDDVHAAKLQLLKAIMPIRPAQVIGQTVRGQYQGYRNEVNKPDSITETYAAVRLKIDDEAWKNVDMVLRTGKAMADKRTEVRIAFQTPGAADTISQLVFTIQPREGISLVVDSQKTAGTAKLETAVSAFNQKYSMNRDAPEHPDAYERVLIDAVYGDHILFTTSQEVLAAWRVVDGVSRVWSQSGNNLVMYSKGAKSVG